MDELQQHLDYMVDCHLSIDLLGSMYGGNYFLESLLLNIDLLGSMYDGNYFLGSLLVSNLNIDFLGSMKVGNQGSQLVLVYGWNHLSPLLRFHLHLMGQCVEKNPGPLLHLDHMNVGNHLSCNLNKWSKKFSLHKSLVTNLSTYQITSKGCKEVEHSNEKIDPQIKQANKGMTRKLKVLRSLVFFGFFLYNTHT